MISPHKLLAVLVAILGLAVATHAQQPPAPTPPPFGVQGFRYEQVQSIDAKLIHWNVCEEAACGPGSTVFYSIGARAFDSFEAFADESRSMAELHRRKLSAGMEFEADPPMVERIGPVKIYESRHRKMSRDAGSKTVVRQILTSGPVQVDLSSISHLPRVAEGNARTFRSMIVIRMAIDADVNRGAEKRK